MDLMKRCGGLMAVVGLIGLVVLGGVRAEADEGGWYESGRPPRTDATVVFTAQGPNGQFIMNGPGTVELSYWGGCEITNDGIWLNPRGTRNRFGGGGTVTVEAPHGCWGFTIKFMKISRACAQMRIYLKDVRNGGSYCWQTMPLEYEYSGEYMMISLPIPGDSAQFEELDRIEIEAGTGTEVLIREIDFSGVLN